MKLTTKKTSRGAGLLVFNAKFATPSRGNGGLDAVGAQRLRRWYLQAVARELLPEHRVAECLRSFVPGAGCVNVHYSKKFDRAHYGNLIQCANVWIDPVCASKITERRRIELESALAGSRWPGVMVTLTFQHTRADKLANLRRDLVAGRRAMKSGKAWGLFKRRYGVVGSISAVEPTFGLSNGWHIHDHSLYLVESLPDLEAMRAEMSQRFESFMADLGRYVSPEIGVHIRVTDRAAGDYISKWGAAFELSKLPAKVGKGEHYTPFQLLYLAGTGTAWAGSVFQEYAAAMRGVNQIRWSPGLRRLLGLGVQPTDAEVVEAVEEDSALMASLSLAQWRIILKREKRGELLEVASSGDAGLLRAYLVTLGVFLES